MCVVLPKLFRMAVNIVSRISPQKDWLLSRCMYPADRSVGQRMKMRGEKQEQKDC